MILKQLQMKQQRQRDTYPFNLPLFQTLETIDFKSPVTIFVGENGSGKTTLLEAIAAAQESILISGEQMNERHFPASYALSEAMKFTWTTRTNKGFFFRASDFITFIQQVTATRLEAQFNIAEITKKDPHSYAIMPHARTLYDLQNLYGEGLEFRSHGESFLELFEARFRPDGLYLLDEPEAPLSPNKQLTLIAMMGDMVKQGAQFIISTHSPILMAFPGATLLEIKEDRLSETAFNELEHVQLTRDFLNDPARYLRYLLD
ncbi:AAA family ATPase [Solibacillus sp. CAU 1738]|uniref:AAA family ATPase n=1 Tax=Solibacillus sp. CAU 1738 TaxID=3140363 RepID=UPI0032613D2B